jgi:hypothetical protein
MPTLFKNTLQSQIGTTPVTVLTSSTGVKTTVVGLSLTNLTASVILASIQLNDTVAGTSAYFLTNTVIPPNQSLRVINGGERLVLGPSTTVVITASQAASLDLVLSYVEIS